jgi:peroxiredoxin Q/BCP
MSMYGRRYYGALRATFIIGPDAIVAHVIPRVTRRTHDDEVLTVLEQLAAA